MTLRSFLFVPGNSERKLEKARASRADALILDLEDSVASAQLVAARGRVARFLAASPERSRQQLWVRVGGLRSGQCLDDLGAVMAGRPCGIVLPKSDSADDVLELGSHLSALESRKGMTVGSTRILVITGETPSSLFKMGTYERSSPRLFGLTWGIADLSAAVGAVQSRRDDGSFDDLYRWARTLCLAAARAAGVEPVDGVFLGYRDSEGLEAEARDAKRQGFTSKLAIHPGQIDVIHRAFAPSRSEIEEARAIVAAFAENPTEGAVGIDGRMFDLPHLNRARRLLDIVERDAPRVQDPEAARASRSGASDRESPS